MAAHSLNELAENLKQIKKDIEEVKEKLKKTKGKKREKLEQLLNKLKYEKLATVIMIQQHKLFKQKLSECYKQVWREVVGDEV